MSDLTDLYQEVLLDHSKRPHHHYALSDANYQAHGHNPLCGDEITVYLKVADDTLTEVSFTGQACAICTASASLMTHTLQGESRNEAEALFQTIHHLLIDEDPVDPDTLGELGALGGVHRFPMRVKCATLPWHTLRAALRGQGAVSTE
jgi:nitrogen fixation NifU-like protein